MTAPEEIVHGSIHAALVAALAELTVVEKGRTAKIETKSGGTYSYDFADLADIVKLTRPVLHKHGLVALTPVHDHPQGLAVTVKVIHTSGESMDFGPFPFPHGADARATGSFVTYHRRYALVAALGMATGDDDDGEAAKPRQTAPQPTLTPEQYDRKRRMDLVAELAKGNKTLAREAWEYMSGEAMEGFNETAIREAFAVFMSPEPEEDKG